MRAARMIGIIFGVIFNRIIWMLLFEDDPADGINLVRVLTAGLFAMFFASVFQRGYAKFSNKDSGGEDM
jgi:hypothetical protein